MQKVHPEVREKVERSWVDLAWRLGLKFDTKDYHINEAVFFIGAGCTFEAQGMVAPMSWAVRVLNGRRVLEPSDYRALGGRT